MAPCKKCGPNPVNFPVLEGCHLGPQKNLGSLRFDFYILYFLGGWGKWALSNKQWFKSGDFSVLGGVDPGRMKVPPWENPGYAPASPSSRSPQETIFSGLGGIGHLWSFGFSSPIGVGTGGQRGNLPLQLWEWGQCPYNFDGKVHFKNTLYFYFWL